MKNKLITPTIVLLILSMQQLSAQVDGKSAHQKKDTITIIDTTWGLKPIKIPINNFLNSTQIRISALSKIGVISNNDPIYVLTNNNRVLDFDIGMINPSWIKEIEVIKDTSAITKYLSKAGREVICLTLKEDLVFLSVKKIVSVYNLPEKCAKYPVYINEKYCANDAILLERSKIKSVRAVTRLMSGIDEKQLEITTVEKTQSIE